MDQTLNQLLATMDDETAGYREMQAILADERAAASLSNKNRLGEVGQQKQALVTAIQEMENKRQSLVEKLAAEHGIQERPLTASRLTLYLEAPQATRLTTCARELKSIIKSVQRENNANSQLFSHSLELIQSSLKLLNELVYSHCVYHKPGSEQRATGYGGGKGRVYYGSI